MKKIHIILGLTLISLLSACSLGSSTTTTTISGADASILQTYQADDYQVTIPKAWEITRKDEFTSDIPQNASAVFQANRKNEVFITNVNVTKNILGTAMTPLDYGKIVMENQKTSLQNFVEKSREEINTTISGTKTTVLLAKFEGKRTATDPTIAFIQSYYVKGTTGYIITAAYVPSEDPSVQKEAEQIVRSLTIK